MGSRRRKKGSKIKVKKPIMIIQQNIDTVSMDPVIDTAGSPEYDSTAMERVTSRFGVHQDKTDENMMEVEDSTAHREFSSNEKKKLRRLTLLEMKLLTSKPHLFDNIDCASDEPIGHAALKAHRRYFPLPQHWKSKRAYLQSKKRFIKRPFSVPKIITNIGIDLDTAASAPPTKVLQDTLQKQKFGKFNVFGKLHGQIKTGDFIVGNMSQALQQALGVSESDPVPWLEKMKEFGPPPAYKKLCIPGINAPLPILGDKTARFSHKSPWGMPPINSITQIPKYGPCLDPPRKYIFKTKKFGEFVKQDMDLKVFNATEESTDEFMTLKTEEGTKLDISLNKEEEDNVESAAMRRRYSEMSIQKEQKTEIEVDIKEEAPVAEIPKKVQATVTLSIPLILDEDEPEPAVEPSVEEEKVHDDEEEENFDDFDF
ncbi:hypothetical protein PCE1_000977 [Barthelona sp. PCE]